MTTDLNDYLQRSAYLGVETKQTVYAAELRGLAEGAQLARPVRRPYHTRIIFFTDSQAAISALRGGGRTSGQVYLIHALEGLERLSQLANPTVEVRWIPAHARVPGNEVADQLARQAALRGLDPAQSGADYLLASAAKSATRQRIMDKWLRQWRLLPVANTARPTKRLLPGSGWQSLRLYQNLTKLQSSALVQMRTMRIGLNHYLFKIKQVESDRCSCEEGSQTPKHVLTVPSLVRSA
jgi:ribonuclease HI